MDWNKFNSKEKIEKISGVLNRQEVDERDVSRKFAIIFKVDGEASAVETNLTFDEAFEVKVVYMEMIERDFYEYHCEIYIVEKLESIIWDNTDE